MHSSRFRTFRAGLLAALVPLLLVSACTAWRSQTTPPNQLIAEKPKISMRLTTVCCKPFEIRCVKIANDTLSGFLEKRPRHFPKEWILERSRTTLMHYTPDYVFIPLESVQKIEVRRFSVGNTFGLVLGLGVTAFVVAVAVVFVVESQQDFCCSSGSCPLILSWDGDGWRLDSGTYAGAIMPALARSDVDNLEHAIAKDGIVRLRLTGLSGETEHVDALRLLAVDHDPDVSVVPDGRGNLHTVGRLIAPLCARDFDGRDVSNRVSKLDEWCWESRLTERDPTTDAKLRDGIEIEFPRSPEALTAKLVIDGTNTVWAMHVLRELVSLHGQGTQAWYDAMAADPAKVERIKTTFAREAFLGVSVWGPDGWERQSAVWESGPELFKRQVVLLDLSRAAGETVRVRLDSTPNFWLVDRVALDYSPDLPVHTTEQRLETAHDMMGRDVRALLDAQGFGEYVIAPGDTAEVAFRVPPTPEGQHRTYLARTTGWYHLNTSEVGEPQTALLDRIETENLAAARFAVGRMNRTLVVAAGEPSE